MIWVGCVKDSACQTRYAVLFWLLGSWWVSKAFGETPEESLAHLSGQAVFSSPTIYYFSLWREAPEKGNSLQFNGAF